jgi:hypothetical protein
MEFYRPTSIERCKKRGLGDRGKNHWLNTPEKDVYHRGELSVRRSWVLRELGQLGLTKEMLGDWNRRGWPILNGEKPRAHWGYYLLAKIEAARKAIANLPSRIPDNHPTLYPLETANTLTELDLQNADTRRKHKLVAESFLARIDITTRGKATKLICEILGVTRESVADFLKRKAICQLPANTTTPMALARRLRKLSQKKCIITHTTIARWCAEGLLDSVYTDFWNGRNENRKSWIITNECAADIEKALRRNGWNSREAGAELRMLYNQRLAANGGPAPPSLAVKCLADMRNKVEVDWEKKAPAETRIARVNGGKTKARCVTTNADRRAGSRQRAEQQYPIKYRKRSGGGRVVRLQRPRRRSELGKTDRP